MTVIAESGRARQKMQIVSPHLKLKQKRQPCVYDPMLVSIGPYHHMKPQLHPFENKLGTVNMLIHGTRDRQIYFNNILERIYEIRSCYPGGAYGYTDDYLSEMMFEDASFIICSIMVWMRNKEFMLLCQQHVGIPALTLSFPELFMLENQIPYWVLKLVIMLSFGENKGKEIICKFWSSLIFGEYDKLTVIPWEEGEDEEPLHLLEAYQRLLAHGPEPEREQEMGRCSNSTLTKFVRKKKDDVQRLSGELVSVKHVSRQFYSVTYLKAKGIQFKPSSTCLKDVRFESHALYGLFQLPIWFVSYDDYVFFNNMIAFEMCPGPKMNLVVTSYVNLMKTLIEGPNDVKELREKGILFSNLSDVEVVKLFQEIDTLGVGIDFLYGLKMSIHQHCMSKTKTWVAELIYTYFRSPWTAIALLAATVLIVLTFLQTYYTISCP